MTEPIAVVVAALVLVATVVVPWLRLPLDGAFRQVFGRASVVVVVAAVAWTVVVAVVAVFAPAVVMPAAAVAVVVVAAATWRARRLVGGGHRRPPGSLSVIGSIRALAHRDAYQVDHERYGPVFTASQFGRPVVCVVGLERGQRLLRGHRHQLGPSPLAFTDQVMGGFLRYMDDDTHDRYGPAFRLAMSRPVTDAARSIAFRTVSRELAAVTTQAEHPGPAMGRVAQATLMAALFGLDVDSPDGEVFGAVNRRFSRRTVLGGHRRTTGALRELRTLVADQRRRLEAGDVDAVCALGEFVASDDDLPDAVCVDNLLFMMRIGAPNLQGLLVWLVHLLAANPQWLDRCRDDNGGPEVVDGFVLEALRMAQSEYLYRRLTKDVDFDGLHLRHGQLVRLCVWESHQDPTVFSEPGRCTDRFVNQRFSQSEFSAFGLDNHACNSVGLVLMAARTVVQAVAADPGMELTPATGLTRGMRHWSHWRPGDDLSWVRRA